MSPLQITMLLRLYVRPEPFSDMPVEQVNAPAMQQAFAFFREHGLLNEQVTWVSVKHGRVGYPFLTLKGKELVQRLCEVKP